MNSWCISPLNIFLTLPTEKRPRTNNQYRNHLRPSIYSVVSKYLSHWKEPGHLGKIGWFRAGVENVQDESVMSCHTRKQGSCGRPWAVTKDSKHTGANMQSLLLAKDGATTTKDGYAYKEPHLQWIETYGICTTHAFITTFKKLICSLWRILGNQLMILKTGK